MQDWQDSCPVEKISKKIARNPKVPETASVKGKTTGNPLVKLAKAAT
ncbi:hypothetical protein LQ564_15400 [Massilia sp. G4R7]|uniref:Uncharacterized protein n=1 Tax=Massilia phyllostachyos TaxID=2898585 RepID=A0ABS8QAP4_9BURK|nr:hypothetical protein [Massilia phyllostachyos]MCD2517700.1 hypothetical protein [Massilia phyllostachyos]